MKRITVLLETHFASNTLARDTIRTVSLKTDCKLTVRQSSRLKHMLFACWFTLYRRCYCCCRLCWRFETMKRVPRYASHAKGKTCKKKTVSMCSLCMWYRLRVDICTWMTAACVRHTTITIVKMRTQLIFVLYYSFLLVFMAGVELKQQNIFLGFNFMHHICQIQS